MNVAPAMMLADGERTIVMMMANGGEEQDGRRQGSTWSMLLLCVMCMGRDDIAFLLPKRWTRDGSSSTLSGALYTELRRPIGFIDGALAV
jgi:hypothetical protein